MLELMELWYFNRTNDGLCIQEIVCSMFEDVEDVVAYDKNPCQNEWGWKDVDKVFNRGSLKVSTTILAS